MPYDYAAIEPKWQKKWADEVRQKLDALEAVSGKGDKRLDADTLKAVREALYGG